MLLLCSLLTQNRVVFKWQAILENLSYSPILYWCYLKWTFVQILTTYTSCLGMQYELCRVCLPVQNEKQVLENYNA